MVDENGVRTVDIGYCINGCHRVVRNVFYGGYCNHSHNHVFCTTTDCKNQYTFPLKSIEYIIPHEEDCVTIIHDEVAENAIKEALSSMTNEEKVYMLSSSFYALGDKW